MAPTEVFTEAVHSQSTLNAVNQWIGSAIWTSLVKKNDRVVCLDAADPNQIADFLQKYDLIVAPGFWMSTFRFRNGREAAVQLDLKKKIEANVGGVLFLDRSSISLEINAIIAKTVPVGLKDISVKKTDGGKYIYSAVSGYPIEFEKDELEDFLAKSLKKMEIMADMTIRCTKGNVGAFVRKNVWS